MRTRRIFDWLCGVQFFDFFEYRILSLIIAVSGSFFIFFVCNEVELILYQMILL